jgi:hypothetical protein
VVVGVILALLAIAVTHLGRRWPRATTTAVTLAIFFGLCLYGLFFLTGNQMAVPSVTVGYHAMGRTDGTTLTLHEKITIDGDTSGAVVRSGSRLTSAELAANQVSVDGWQFAGTVDGYPTYKRDRTVVADQSDDLTTTMRVPLDLGVVTIVGEGETDRSYKMLPRSPSTVELTVPKGGLAKSYPGSSDPLDVPGSSDTQALTIAVDENATQLSLTILKPFMRFYLGKQIYGLTDQATLPLVGTVLGIVITWLIKNRAEALATAVFGSIGRRIFRRRVTKASS